ncbi:ribosomal L7Ae/L30e/S12e/Gadd45 family protein [Candidatus Woesearchaeota archaeon]|nr:ribosomal L7Ae/L30e/S12e/Gadd45 family protein [Candidatus Woesearchaeota archaeon]
MEEIKNILEKEKIVLGTDEVMKNLKKGRIIKVLVAKNCNGNTKKDLERYSTLYNFELKFLDIDNDELGSLCKKLFSVSLVGVLK